MDVGYVEMSSRGCMLVWSRGGPDSVIGGKGSQKNRGRQDERRERPELEEKEEKKAEHSGS